MIQAVLIEFTRSTCCRKKGDRMWTSKHLADIYIKRRKIAKMIRMKKRNKGKAETRVAHAEM